MVSLVTLAVTTTAQAEKTWDFSKIQETYAKQHSKRIHLRWDPRLFYSRCNSSDVECSVYSDGSITINGEKDSAEHLVTASRMMKHFNCGDVSRRTCALSNESFNKCVSNPFNIVAAHRRLNYQRGNKRFVESLGEGALKEYKFDWYTRKGSKTLSPPDYTRGRIGRTFIYMLTQNCFTPDEGEMEMMHRWDELYPATLLEDEINISKAYRFPPYVAPPRAHLKGCK